jgi:hypothetical protein
MTMADMDKTGPQADGLDDRADLDNLFAAARGARPALPAHLSAAILADAAAQQPGCQPGEADRIRRPARWRQLLNALGGWPAVGGLAMASATGLWLGLAPPSFVPDPVALAGLDADSETMPFDSYDMAMVLSEDLQ